METTRGERKKKDKSGKSNVGKENILVAEALGILFIIVEVERK